MDLWRKQLNIDPVPILVASDNEAVIYFVRRDLLEEDVGPVDRLRSLPGAVKIVRKQKSDGSWTYPGGNKHSFPETNYNLLETYRQISVLIDKYGFNQEHQAIERAADYLFSFQTGEGDFRGILGTQYMPYYMGVIMECLIKAGYGDDPRIELGLEWLLSMRQHDGGWLIPVQAMKSKPRELWSSTPVKPDRVKPFSHLATGMILRAFAVHSKYRNNKEAIHAADLLKERMFKPDKYNDRRSQAYWTKFQYPFWWPNILTALDTFSSMGFGRDDPQIQGALQWFVENQRDDGLWNTEYENKKGIIKPREQDTQLWVGLAICRVMKSYFT